MTLREVIDWLNSVSKNTYYGLVFFILFFACAGLIVFSIRGFAKENFEVIYFFIGTAITLSGFTMLSGMFEKTEKKTKIERKLFRLSILFLFSAFSFILFLGLYSLFKGESNNNFGEVLWNVITMSTYFVGILFFFIGFATLILVLIQYSNQIDLDANPPEIYHEKAAPEEITKKNWWQFWKILLFLHC